MHPSEIDHIVKRMEAGWVLEYDHVPTVHIRLRSEQDETIPISDEELQALFRYCRICARRTTYILKTQVDHYRDYRDCGLVLLCDKAA